MSPEAGCPDPTQDATPEAPGRFYGKYRGEVVENIDEELRGRILAVVPAVPGAVQNWALPCVPYAGEDVGSYHIPPVGANVWIEFEGGNPNYPIWSGCWWELTEFPAPEELDPADAPLVKIVKTKFNTFYLNDTPTEGGIELQTETAAVDVEPPIKMTFKTEGVTILCGISKIFMSPEEGITLTVGDDTVINMTPESIEMNAGTISLTATEGITANAGAGIEMTADEDVSVAATTGAVEITAGADVSAEAGGGVEITAGVDASVEATGGVEISAGGAGSFEAGGELNLSAGGNFSAEGGLAAELSAGLDLTLTAAGAAELTAIGNVDITGILQTMNGAVEVDGDLLIDGQQPLVV